MKERETRDKRALSDVYQPMRMFEEYQNLSLDVGADATMPVEAEEVEGERNALQLYRMPQLLFPHRS